MNDINNINMYYTWIIDNVSIGELNSEYQGFDIVINLAYINPFFNKGLKHRSFRHKIIREVEIYEFGLYDSEQDIDYLKEILDFIIPILLSDNSKKILFHCQSGKSRSVSLALAYLCKKNLINNITEIDKYLNLIKIKRPVINPRASFIKMVKEYLEQSSS
jgi:protein-tyrosine phosphatase